MFRKHRVVVAVVVCGLLLPLLADAQTRDRDRPIRVGNTNLVVVGGGVNTHDHPTFGSSGFVNLSYQRRVLRRELRALPVWARGAVHFTAKDDDFHGYTIWRSDSQVGGRFETDVQERMSDFTVRVELLGDLLHSRNSALYAGGGFTVHVLNFNTRGGSNSFEGNDSPVAPSAVVGGRVFPATQPYTLYGEVRYGFTYGRFEYPQNEAPLDVDFRFESVNSISFEGGVGLHW